MHRVSVLLLLPCPRSAAAAIIFPARYFPYLRSNGYAAHISPDLRSTATLQFCCAKAARTFNGSLGRLWKMTAQRASSHVAASPVWYAKRSVDGHARRLRVIALRSSVPQTLL